MKLLLRMSVEIIPSIRLISLNMENEQGQFLDHDLLIRIDERTLSIQTSVDNIKKSVVLKGEFLPIRNIVFGLSGTILVAVVGALMSLILNK